MIKYISFALCILSFGFVVGCATTSVPATTTSSSTTTTTSGGTTTYSQYLSNITSAVKSRCRTVLSSGSSQGRRSSVFGKVGDSLTASDRFLKYMGVDENIDLGSFTSLASTLNYFRSITFDANGGPYPNSFGRTSKAAGDGWKVSDAIGASYNASNLKVEINEINPAIAIILFGGNDLVLSPITTTEFFANMTTLIDYCENAGVIPVISTIHPLHPSDSSTAEVVPANSQLISLANLRNIPYVDLYNALLPLPNNGIETDPADNNTHPSVYFPAGTSEPYQSGRFTSAGLQYGYNVRNLLTLMMLEKIKRIIIDDGAPE